MNNLEHRTFGFQGTFSPTWKVKDLARIMELFGELEEEKEYPEGMEVCILGNPTYIHKYMLYYIFNGLYIVNIESLKGEVFTMAFLDKDKLDEAFFPEEGSFESLEEDFTFLFDFKAMREMFQKGEDNKEFEMEKYACPLDLVYILLTNYLVFLYGVLSYNFVHITEARDSNSFDKVSFIDTSIVRNITCKDFTYEKFESLARDVNIKDLHKEMVEVAGNIPRKDKGYKAPLRSNDSFIIRNPISGVFGLVNRSLLKDDPDIAVRFLKEEDVKDLIKKWNPQYAENMWKISGKESYLKEMDTSVCWHLVFRELIATEYSLASIGKSYNGSDLNKFDAWKIKRKLKKVLNS